MSIFPRGRVPRLVLFHFEAAADDLAGLGDAANGAVGNGLHHDVAYGRGLNWPGDDEAIAGVGRRLAEQAVLRAAADDVDRLDPAAGKRLAIAQHLAELQRQAVVVRNAAQRPRPAGPSGQSAQKSAIVCGMLSGAMNSAASGLMNETSGWAAIASRVRSSQCQGSPPWLHTRRHSCTSHSPVMFFKRRTVFPTPPSLVKLSFKTCSLINGRGDSMPIKAHVPRLI